jgi:exosortase E/protease (VPEID-CTERM system)
MWFWPKHVASSLTQTALPVPIVATERRIVLLLIYITCQVALAKFIITTGGRPDGRVPILAIPGGLFHFVLYFTLGFLLLLSTRFQVLWGGVQHAASSYPWVRMLLPQAAASLLMIYAVSRQLPSEAANFHEAAPNLQAWWRGLEGASIALTSLLSLGLIAPVPYWWRVVRKEKATLLLACIFPLSRLVVNSLVIHAEDWLSVPTIKVTRLLLSIVYSDVEADAFTKTLGTSSFKAVIDHMCSGYEGISMITVFMVWYLYSFRRNFRFPAALLLFPIAALAIWLSNCLRIALLIAMGTSLSSDIAVEGYHANAGWIFFIVVTLGVVWFARSSAFFCRDTGPAGIVIDANNALAVPFLVMLAATLISSAFSADFPWLYPLRIIACVGVMTLLWKHFDLQANWPRLFPVLAGIAVFVLWITAVSPGTEAEKRFSATLFAVPVLWSSAWIVLRVCGSVVVVPIAEELAFRGYLPAFLGRIVENKYDSTGLHWAPFVVSSLLFGILHNAWIASTLAGAVYYLVRQRSGRLWDSIIAHATTNLLLSGYVLLWGYWSYW